MLKSAPVIHEMKEERMIADLLQFSLPNRMQELLDSVPQ
jgi:hypothetical protein